MTTATESNTTTMENKDKPVLKSAPPPWHSVALVGVIFVASLLSLPSASDFDENVARNENLTRRLFPDLISISLLGYIRGCMAFVIWGTVIFTILVGDITIQTPYLPGSKLKRTNVRLKGYKLLLTFTSWSWMILGCYFTLASYICFVDHVPKPILRLTFALWETIAPLTVLVSAVVRFVLWPELLKNGSSRMFRYTRALLMHNANVFFAIMEASVLSGLPVRWQHISLSPILGCLYIVFTWWMCTKWTRKEDGPQFVYFFFDTTAPGLTPSLAILGLFLVLFASFALFIFMENIISVMENSGFLVHMALGIALSSSVMRFRD